MNLTAEPGGARTLLGDPPPIRAAGLAWLGQAGFLIRHARHRLLIDPYLSNYLARKYAGTELPHLRLMPPPIEAGAIHDLDLVLCTHRHSDHADPESLPVLARNNPECRFVFPRADLAAAIEMGLDESKLIAVNDGDTIRIGDWLELHVLASAHETLEVNERGEHHFLGYVMRLGELAVYHSGDSVVYDGLAKRLAALKPALALLPANGRSEYLRRRRIAGNMTFREAADLCLAAGIPWLMPHHFGMFEFNTADPARLRAEAARLESDRLQCIVPDVASHYLAG